MEYFDKLSTSTSTSSAQVLRQAQHKYFDKLSTSTSIIKQKSAYIHSNPVKAGYVTQPTHWKYSSANNIANENPAFEIDEIGFLG